jgi:hypothetical protein
VSEQWIGVAVLWLLGVAIASGMEGDATKRAAS